MRSIFKDMEYALRNLFTKARTTPTDCFYITEPCGDYYLLAVMKSKYGVTYSITDMTKEGFGNVKFIKKALEFKDHCMERALRLWHNKIRELFCHEVTITTIKGTTIDGTLSEITDDGRSPITLHITKLVWSREADYNEDYNPYTNPRPPRQPVQATHQINSDFITNIEEVSNYEIWKNNEMSDMQKKSPCGKVMDA